MSATAATSGEGKRARRGSDPTTARVFFVVFSGVVLVVLATWSIPNAVLIKEAAPTLVLWALLIAVTDLMPVKFWGRITLAMSLPVALGAGILLPPLLAGLVTFVASLDPREFRGQVAVEKGLFNRSQICVSVVLASLVFHSFGVGVAEWPEVVFPGMLAIAADFLVNIVLVSFAASLINGIGPTRVLKEVGSGVPLHYSFIYFALGLFALLLAVIVDSVGMWGAIAFLAPLAIARQTFRQTLRVCEAASRLEEKNRALLSASALIADERRDERMVMAGEIHDEVLPPLFKVHLMGQVLRQDLIAGRLLDLDVDLPELLSATLAAQSAIRALVSDLRRSSIGSGGLLTTMQLLARQLESAGSPQIHLDLNEVGGSKLAQLLTYQVAREAMNNASRHARASTISVRLSKADGLIRLVVEDNGVGFDPRTVDKEAHFGLQLIAERVEAARGRVIIDSKLGAGTTVAATLPPDV